MSAQTNETQQQNKTPVDACNNSVAKTNKPFCSIAYLAKSSFAINGKDSIRTVNSPSCQTSPETQKQQRSGSSETGKSTVHTVQTNVNNYNENSVEHNQHSSLSSSCNDAASSGSSSGNSSDTTSYTSSSIVDVFGEINEEQLELSSTACVDDIDGVCSTLLNTRRPWELANAYVKRIPPALMTATQLNNGGSENHGLPSLNKLNSMDCWDYTIELECLKGPQDLQLAAELGKTLLERNKELETLLKEHKATIDEQEQEIVYLKKHTTALREVNDSRLKVYEQLEVGIQDLERANHRLLVENTNDKKHIKTLTHNIETLETRCDELTKQLDETRQALSMERRKNERLLQERVGNGNDATTPRLRPTETAQDKNKTTETGDEVGFDANTTAPENCSFAFQSPTQRNNANSTGISQFNSSEMSVDLSMVCSSEDNDELIKLVNDLETTKKALMSEQQRCGELEEQLVAIIQENQTLQSRFAQNSANEEMRSMHDELSILDEVRQGQMCSRCLRAVEDRATVNDEASSLAPTEECDEDEERSLLGLDCNNEQRDNDNCSDNSQAAYRSNVSIKVPNSLDLHGVPPASPNPYRDLVEKYEALLEVQRTSIVRKSTGNSMSLAEEFQTTGDFNQTQKLMYQAATTARTSGNYNSSTNGDEASSCNGSMSNDAASNSTKDKNGRGRTPTEFSEAETTSSGFADETSNKYTQTDERPGYFLCSIGDGEDCKFSIYDDASPIDSRFRNRPEYRELFKEIFAVLKKAAENKEEGEKLPLLDDTNPNAGNSAAAAVNSAKVPPVTPANEELPVDFGDDTQSIISSAVSEQSFAMSECITKLERKTAKKHIIEKNQENKPPSMVQLATANAKEMVENGRVLTPLKREPLEYLSVGVGIKKKNRRKNRNFSTERAESPAALPSPPRFFVGSGKKRKDMRPFVPSPMAATPEQQNQAGARASRASGIGGGPRYEWNGNSMIIYNRGMQTPPHLRGRELDLNGSIEYRPSTVSQELHKLKNLDLSYAEVLRRADACKHHHQQQQHQQHRRRQTQQQPHYHH